ncbi:MAG: hypothetical protein ACRDPQ_06285 [Nocardioidaceae bacterium]
MQVTQVDERDSGWEDDAPRFRVYLHGSGETSTAGWTDTYDITGADVLQAIDWAQRQAREQLIYAVALVRDDADPDRLGHGAGRGLVWLVGMDGNDVTNDHDDRVTQARMLARRQNPVGIPEADRAPWDVSNPYAHDAEER